MTIHIADGAAQERAKYAEIWSMEEYQKAVSPGLESVERFMSVVKPKEGSTILDIGCGSGAAMVEFERLGLKAFGLDITDVGLRADVDKTGFIEGPLWSDWINLGWDYGFCCDVMEHIPPEYTMLCIDRALTACGLVWFQIALLPDEFGKLIGQPLHLTVRPFDWWLIRMATLGKVTDARDLCGHGLYLVTR